MALLHHVTVDVLRAAFFALKKRAASGIDAVMWDMCEEHREDNLRDRHARIHAGTERQRPLGIAAIEDKIFVPKRQHEAPAGPRVGP